MKPKKSCQAFTQSNLFGGHGTVNIWNLLNTAAPPFSAVLWCELEAGGTVGKHRQQRDPEIVICLAGSGEAVVDDQRHTLVAGSMVYLPHGKALSLTNSQSEPMYYLIIKARQTAQTD